jgi:hypothetical protein
MEIYVWSHDMHLRSRGLPHGCFVPSPSSCSSIFLSSSSSYIATLLYLSEAPAALSLQGLINMASLSLNPGDLSSFSNGTQFDLSLGSEGGDLLGTPAAESKRYTDAPETPTASRTSRPSRAGTMPAKGVAALTLRDQEKV